MGLAIRMPSGGVCFLSYETLPCQPVDGCAPECPRQRPGHPAAPRGSSWSVDDEAVAWSRLAGSPRPRCHTTPSVPSDWPTAGPKTFITTSLLKRGVFNRETAEGMALFKQTLTLLNAILAFFWKFQRILEILLYAVSVSSRSSASFCYGGLWGHPVSPGLALPLP